jgi:iron complex outermembrane receptor protein
VIPASSTVRYVSGFFQDEIRLANSLFLTLGSKLEHNGYTGLEYEPGAQLVWTPSERHTLWTSASRAIRQPNRTDFGVRFNLGVAAINGIPAVLTLSGNSGVKAEQLFDYEAGYRAQIHPRLGLGVATFLSYYRNLETTEPGQPFLAENPGVPPYFVIPVAFANLARARNYGGELYFHWTAARRWTLSPEYSFLQMSVQPEPGSRDAARSSISGYSAKHRLQVRSVLSLRPNVEWSAAVRYVSRLATPNIASYVAADTTLRWRARDDLEFSITGQNLLNPGRLEFSDLTMILIASQVRRNAFVKLAWRF